MLNHMVCCSVLPPRAGWQVPRCREAAGQPPDRTTCSLRTAWLSWAMDCITVIHYECHRSQQHTTSCVTCSCNTPFSKTQSQRTPRTAPQQQIHHLCPLHVENHVLVRFIKMGRTHAARPSWGMRGSRGAAPNPTPVMAECNNAHGGHTLLVQQLYLGYGGSQETGKPAVCI